MRLQTLRTVTDGESWLSGALPALKSFSSVGRDVRKLVCQRPYPFTIRQCDDSHLWEVQLDLTTVGEKTLQPRFVMYDWTVATRPLRKWTIKARTTSRDRLSCKFWCRGTARLMSDHPSLYSLDSYCQPAMPFFRAGQITMPPTLCTAC